MTFTISYILATVSLLMLSFFIFVQMINQGSELGFILGFRVSEAKVKDMASLINSLASSSGEASSVFEIQKSKSSPLTYSISIKDYLVCVSSIGENKETVPATSDCASHVFKVKNTYKAGDVNEVQINLVKKFDSGQNSYILEVSRAV